MFGKLFAKLGLISFMNRIKITGGNTIVGQLIDRAITQRLALTASFREITIRKSTFGPQQKFQLKALRDTASTLSHPS